MVSPAKSVVLHRVVGFADLFGKFVRVVLRYSLNEQHSSRLGSAVFGLFPKLHEQAGSFASSKITGSVLAYGSRAGWVQVA